MKFHAPDEYAAATYVRGTGVPKFGWLGATYFLSGYVYRDEYELYVWSKGYSEYEFFKTGVPQPLGAYFKDIVAAAEIYNSCPDYQETPFWEFLNMCIKVSKVDEAEAVLAEAISEGSTPGEVGWSDGYQDSINSNPFKEGSKEWKLYEEGYEDGCQDC